VRRAPGGATATATSTTLRRCWRRRAATRRPTAGATPCTWTGAAWASTRARTSRARSRHPGAPSPLPYPSLTGAPFGSCFARKIMRSRREREADSSRPPPCLVSEQGALAAQRTRAYRQGRRPCSCARSPWPGARPSALLRVTEAALLSMLFAVPRRLRQLRGPTEGCRYPAAIASAAAQLVPVDAVGPQARAPPAASSAGLPSLHGASGFGSGPKVAGQVWVGDANGTACACTPADSRQCVCPEHHLHQARE